jgi:hypothetical protein
MENTGELVPSSPDRFQCPGCDEEVDVAAELAGQLVKCPYCNSEFFASHDQLHAHVVDDTFEEKTELDRESAFDKLRIENYTALRMGAIRSRSWWIIACFLSFMTMLDMLGKSIIFVCLYHTWGIYPSLRILCAIGVFPLAKHAWRRAEDFKREIEKSAIPEPTTPPDFSTLGNGNDQWKNLENVR